MKGNPSTAGDARLMKSMQMSCPSWLVRTHSFINDPWRASASVNSRASLFKDS